MWTFLKFIGGLVKAIFWLAVILALAGIALLYMLEQDVPDPLVRRLSDALSNDNYLCHIGRATFSLRSGLHLYQVKALQKRVADTALVSADEFTVAFNLDPQLLINDRLHAVTLRSITIRNLNMPTLPPRQHHATNAVVAVAAPTNAAPAAAHADIDLPTLAPFQLTLERVNVLGVQADQLSAVISIDHSRISADQLSIHWPDKTFNMSVDGSVYADFTERIVNGNVKGQAFPSDIMPLLIALHARSAIKQIDLFGGIDRPVNAGAAFRVNIDNSDFALNLSLDVGPCTYRGVPMKYAKGTLDAYETNVFTTVVVGPLQAESSTGPLAGRLVYKDENGSLELEASASMDINQLAAIIDLLRHGELDPVHCDIPPTITAKGIIAVDKKSTVVNDLTGQISLPSGSIFKLPLKDVTSDFAVKGSSALFNHIAGASSSGGKISSNVEFFFPDGAATSTLFTTRSTFSNVSLTDFSRVFTFADSRAGIVSGNLSLVGRAGSHTIASLAGDGKVRISDGMLSRMPLFAGFTDYLARNIPGVSSLVDQSNGSMDFAIEDGVLRTDDLLIEGSLFSIKGRGSCDLNTDKLDFLVRANFLKEKTIAGRITHLVTLPFTRLLLEFKVFGTLDKPDWSYVNILEKLTGGISDLSNEIKAPFQSSEKPAKAAEPAQP
jgi:hypothetical protein